MKSKCDHACCCNYFLDVIQVLEINCVSEQAI